MPKIPKLIGDSTRLLIQARLDWSLILGLWRVWKQSFPAQLGERGRRGLWCVGAEGRGPGAAHPQAPGAPPVPVVGGPALGCSGTVGCGLDCGGQAGETGQGASLTRSPRRNHPSGTLGVTLMTLGNFVWQESNLLGICRLAGLHVPQVWIVFEYIRLH